jgi:anti-sigma factor RsiW
LSDYLDGELSPPEERTVAVHLRQCRTCGQLAVELAATIAALHRLKGRVPLAAALTAGHDWGKEPLR